MLIHQLHLAPSVPSCLPLLLLDSDQLNDGSNWSRLFKSMCVPLSARNGDTLSWPVAFTRCEAFLFVLCMLSHYVATCEWVTLFVTYFTDKETETGKDEWNLSKTGSVELGSYTLSKSTFLHSGEKIKQRTADHCLRDLEMAVKMIF